MQGIAGRNVVIKNLTILAPLDAPNTDGVDPGNSHSSRIFYFFGFINAIR